MFVGGCLPFNKFNRGVLACVMFPGLKDQHTSSTVISDNSGHDVSSYSVFDLAT